MSRSTGETTTGPTHGRIRLSGARPGPITTSLRQTVEEAREAGRIVGEARILAALADRVALGIDAAYRVDDLAAVMRGTRELRELLDLLPLTARTEPAGGGPTRDESPRGRVVSILDGPPTVGNEA